MDINNALNEVLVKLFRNINTIEEQAIRTEEYKDVTTNDMHVMEAIGMGEQKNMTTVARALRVTTGTLTISINSLVKKGYVERVRSEEDRRVVLVSLTAKGNEAFLHHKRFHEQMIEAIVEELSEEDKIEEFMFLGLRKTSGISSEEFLKCFNKDICEVYGEIIDRLVKEKLVEFDGNILKLTEYGTDISNVVLSRFLF